MANALQLRRQSPKHAPGTGDKRPDGSTAATTTTTTTSSQPSISSLLAAALSLPALNFASHQVKPAKLSLTPHHLFYLLSRFEELGIAVGPMNVRLESIHAESSSTNYVSFLDQSQRRKGRASDRDSIRSVTSFRSVVSDMSSLWSNLGLGGGGGGGGGGSSSAAKAEKLKAAVDADLKYLYSAFTKIPCLRLAPDRKAGLIQGFEEFPFDTAVPLWAFKNVSALEICDVDFRQFFGWDRVADHVRSLILKRAGLDDPVDLIVNIVLDDMDRRRRRSSRTQASPLLGWTTSSPSLSQHHPDAAQPGSSAPASPNPEARSSRSVSPLPQSVPMARGGSDGPKPPPLPLARPGGRSRSGSHPIMARPGSSATHGHGHGHGHGHVRSGLKRTGSGSSTSSTRSTVVYQRRGSSSNLLAMVQLPSNKWRFLKHLSLADNGLTSISANGLAPLANTLHSLDLSSNLFVQIPDSLATLTCLRALNLSHCMIDSLRTLTRNPLPAITALNLRSNRLVSLAGIERLPALERVDLRDNRLTDPAELARLTGIPDMHELWVADNPFVRTHSAYRVVIFNLFRSAPGHLEDVVVDASGPTSSEKKHLVERNAQPSPASDPVARTADPELGSAPNPSPATPLAIGAGSAPVTAPPAGTPTPPLAEAMTPTPGYQPPKPRSSRRRKGPRRRIVELSRNDIQSASPEFTPPTPRRHDDDDDDDDDRHAVRGSESSRIDDTSASCHLPSPPGEQHMHRHDPTPTSANGEPTRPTLQTTQTLPVPRSSAHEVQNWDISSEAYRKKVEALRSEVGNGWLSVLNEGGWDHERVPHPNRAGSEFGPVHAVYQNPATTKSPAASSHAIVGGGRTLG